MTKRLLVTLRVLLLVITGAARAAAGASYAEMWKPPTTFEWSLHITAEALIVLDIWQSMDIKNHQSTVPGARYLKESNPLMTFWAGDHPADWQFAVGGLVSVGATTALWYVAPPEIRWLVDAVAIYIEGPVVYRNATTWGLELTLPF